jgi:hypothetical protein
MASRKYTRLHWVKFGVNVVLLHFLGIACLFFSASNQALFGLGFLFQE